MVSGTRDLTTTGYNHCQDKCPVCGKGFCGTPEWVYVREIKGHYKRLCSYKCMRAFDKAKEEKRKAEAKKHIQEMEQRLAQLTDSKEIVRLRKQIWLYKHRSSVDGIR